MWEMGTTMCVCEVGMWDYASFVFNGKNKNPQVSAMKVSGKLD